MVPNIGRKITLILLVLLGAVLSLGIPMLGGSFPIRRGLDLQGGTRLVYQVDTERLGKRAQQANRNLSQLIDETIGIIRGRIDPSGVLNITLQRQGSDRILVELPGMKPAEAHAVERLITELGKLEFRIVAYKEAGSDLKGTDIDFDQEKEKLSKWWNERLAAGGETYLDENTILRFNELRTAQGPREGFFWVPLHNPPEPPELKGHVLFLNAFYDSSKSQWAERDESTGVVRIHNLPRGDGKGYLRPQQLRIGGQEEGMGHNPIPLKLRRPKNAKPSVYGDWLDVVLLRDESALSPSHRWVFTGEDLSDTYPDTDRNGYPCVAFVCQGNRADAFADFTETFKKKYMAIVLNGRLSSNPPIIQSRLPGRGIISGKFTQQEVRHLQSVLRSGSLRVPLELMTRDSMGPSLGQDSIRLGGISAFIGILVVVLFMLYYYRRSGRIAASSLVLNMLLLLGALALFRVNLNLPGIAGLILTLGMAVDANILIFERIREERAKKRTLLQSAKNGFDRAFITIFDSNLTTLITTLVLIWLGTGPVKGFAVVLAIGILTSMFSALVISRVLFHFLLQKENFKEFRMRNWVPSTTIQFTHFMGPAVLGSLVLALSGLLVLGTRGRDLMGIDFTGGGTFRVLLKEDTDLVDMRSTMQQGFPSVIVYTLGQSKRNYGVKVKFNPDVDPELAQDVSSKPDITELIEGAQGKKQRGASNLAEEFRFQDVHVALQFPYPITDANLSDIQERLFQQGFVSFPTPAWMNDERDDTNSKRRNRQSAQRFLRANFYTHADAVNESYTPREDAATRIRGEEIAVRAPQVSYDPEDKRKRRLQISARVPIPRFHRYGLRSLIYRALRPRYELGLQGLEETIRELLGDRLAPDFLISDRGVAQKDLHLLPVTTSFGLTFQSDVDVAHLRELLHRVGIRHAVIESEGKPVTPATVAKHFSIKSAQSRWIVDDKTLLEQLEDEGRRLERASTIPDGSLGGISLEGGAWENTERALSFVLSLRGAAPKKDMIARLLRSMGISFEDADLVDVPGSNGLGWRLRKGRSQWIDNAGELRETLARQISQNYPAIVLNEKVTIHLVQRPEPVGEETPEEVVARALRSCGLILGEGQRVGKIDETTFVYDANTLRTLLNTEMEQMLTSEITRAKEENRASLEIASPFGDASEISAQASIELRDSAVIAIIVALFAITLYIRARFHEYRYAFGAVLAVAHDVIVTGGVTAIFASLGLVDAEIDLTMVAALLTIIGYSLNDTIVIYDRIRENLPRMQGTLERIINVSINDTLSRTLLTSLTTLFTIVVLFILNYGRHNAIEGFSFAILVGIICGTYSTVFIASPFVLWAENRLKTREARAEGRNKTATATA